MGRRRDASFSLRNLDSSSAFLTEHCPAVASPSPPTEPRALAGLSVCRSLPRAPRPFLPRPLPQLLALRPCLPPDAGKFLVSGPVPAICQVRLCSLRLAARRPHGPRFSL